MGDVLYDVETLVGGVFIGRCLSGAVEAPGWRSRSSFAGGPSFIAGELASGDKEMVPCVHSCVVPWQREGGTVREAASCGEGKGSSTFQRNAYVLLPLREAEVSESSHVVGLL